MHFSILNSNTGFVLLATICAAFANQNLVASCPAETPSYSGRIVALEHHPLEGGIHGESEYTYRGSWRSTRDYNESDSVFYGGRFWRAQNANTDQMPETDAGPWSPTEPVRYHGETHEIDYSTFHNETESGESYNYETGEWIPWSYSYDSTSSSVYVKERMFTEELSWESECSGGGDANYSEFYGADAVINVQGTWVINSDCGTYDWTELWDGYPFSGTSNLCSYEWCRHRINFETSDPDYNYSLQENLSKTLKTRKESSSFSDSGEDWQESYNSHQHERWTLSEPVSGSAVMQQAIAEIDPESGDWEREWNVGATATAAWAGFSLTGRAVRYRVQFNCLGDDTDLEFHYRVWPVGGEEEADGEDQREVVNTSTLEVEDTENGLREVKGFILPEAMMNKRLMSVTIKGECSGGSNNAGNSNGAGTGSMWWWVSLGRSTAEHGLGNLRVAAETLTSETATPASLRYDGGIHPDVTLIKDESDAISQVLAPDVFVDVVAIDDYSFEIRLYPPEGIEEEIDTVLVGEGTETEMEIEIPTGRYTTEEEPFAVWLVENPGGSTSHDSIVITQIEGDASAHYLFTENAPGDWEMLENNTRREERTKTTLPNGDIETILTVKNAAGVASSKVKTVERYFDFGRRTIERVVDPDGDALTTTWTYYDDEQNDGGTYAQIKEVQHPDGSWQRFEYDAAARITKTVTPWLDAAPGAPEAQSRVVATTFTENSGETTVTTFETIAGQEVSRSYRVRSPGGTQTTRVVCTEPGAGISAASNLVTITHYISGGDFDGRIDHIEHPDATLTTYTYQKDTETDETTTTIRRGAASGSGDTVVDGRETVTIEDAEGRVVSRVSKDIASDLQLESRLVFERDEKGRPADVLFGDGTTEETTYSCCGVSTFKARDGTVTTYTYDDLQRVETQTRDGITLHYTYDSSDRVLTRTREGTDQSLITVETNTYDLAGRLTSRTDALNQTTTFDETHDSGTGRTTRTTTLPDAISERVEVRHRDGQLVEVSGAAAYPVVYEYGAVTGGLRYTKEIRLGEGGADTEWIRTFTDMGGRRVRVEYPDAAEDTFHYNSLGQLAEQVDPDGVTRLFTYNDKGERFEEAVDATADGLITPQDRRVKTERSVVAGGPYGVLNRTVSSVGTAFGYVVEAISESSPNGRYHRALRHGRETITETTYDGTGGDTRVTTHPDDTITTETFTYGRILSRSHEAADSTGLGSTSYHYDAHHRLEKTIDGRTTTETVYTYNDNDQVTSIDVGGMVTTHTIINSLGQVEETVLPGINRVLTRDYLPTGLVIEEGGTATYPVTYAYDPQGRRTEMTTASGTTTWSYHPQRGWLSAKTDAAEESTAYIYTPAGRTDTRTWARGVTTSYGYNDAGEQTDVTYSDGTPGVVNTFDERGRLDTVSDAAGTRTISHNAAGQTEAVIYNTGPFATWSVQRAYDDLDRLDEVSVHELGHGQPRSRAEYGYGASTGRLDTITGAGVEAAYTYEADSQLVSDIHVHRATATPLAVSQTWDNLNRLTNHTSAPAAAPAMPFGYQYDSAGRREERQQADGDYWVFEYDTFNQLDTAVKKNDAHVSLPGYSWDYRFDVIGNRENVTTNGQTSTYTVNALNQITARTIPRVVQFQGQVHPDAALALNQDAPVSGVATNVQRLSGNPHWFAEADYSQAADPNAPKHDAFTLEGILAEAGHNDTDAIAEVQVSSLLKADPEDFQYDLDGNLLSDGLWDYAWDAENRLISIEHKSALAAFFAANNLERKRLEFAYDSQSRRVQKDVSVWDAVTATWVLQESKRWLYDNWNPLVELSSTDGQTYTFDQSYLWGLDLAEQAGGYRAGSPVGAQAGGVGGLLAITSAESSKTLLTAYDGHGNVMGLVDADSGEIVAEYEYSPFGETLRATGPMAEQNPFRFSTKYTDEETDLIYYGFRYYDPETGRWPSRDPINEIAHMAMRGEEEFVWGEEMNVYSFISNNSINFIDILGLESLIVGLYGAGLRSNTTNAKMTEIASAVGADRMFSSRDVRGAVNYIRREYKNHNCRVRIFGFSWGGASAIVVANRLANRDLKPEIIIEVVAVVDAHIGGRFVYSTSLTGKVDSFWNRYRNQEGGGYKGRRIATSGKTTSNQLNVNPDGNATTVINGEVVTIDHGTILWAVGDDFINAITRN